MEVSLQNSTKSEGRVSTDGERVCESGLAAAGVALSGTKTTEGARRMSGRRQGSIDGGGVEAASLHFTGRGPRLRRSPQLRLHSSVTAHGMGWLALLILGMEGGKKSDAARQSRRRRGGGGENSHPRRDMRTWE